MKIVRDLNGYRIDIPVQSAAEVGLLEGDDVTVRATPDGDMEIVRANDDGVPVVIARLHNDRRTIEIAMSQ